MASSTGTVSARFSLEGTDEAKTAVDSFVKDAEKALETLKKVAPGANFDALSKSIDTVKKSSADVIQPVTGMQAIFNSLRPAVQSASGQFEGLATSLFASARGFVGLGSLSIAGIAAGLFAIAESAVSSATGMNKAAAAAGLTFEKYQQLAQAAKASGLDQDKLNVALRKFTQAVDSQGQEQFKNFIDLVKEFLKLGGGTSIKVVDVNDLEKAKQAALELAPSLKAALVEAKDIRGNQTVEQLAALLARAAGRADEVGEKFRSIMGALGKDTPALSTFEALDKMLLKSKGDLAALGITLVDQEGKIKAPEQALLEYIDAVSKLPTAAQRASAVIKVFGRQAGPELADLISKGLPNLDAIAEKMKTLGIGFSAEDLQKAKAARQSMKELEVAATQLKNELGISLAPIFTALAGGLTHFLLKQRQDFAQVKGIAISVWNAIGSAAQATWDAIKNSGIGTALADMWQTVSADAKQAWQDISGAVETAFNFVKGLFTGESWATIWDGLKNATSTAWEFIKTGVLAAWEATKTTVSEAISAITTFVGELPGKVGAALAGLADIILQPFRDAAAGVQAALQPAIDFVRNLLDMISQVRIPSFSGAGAGEGGGSGFASGTNSPLLGPGSWTSDSIIARLSRGEAVLQARSVAALIRHFGGGIVGILNNWHKMPGFALGGMVDSLIGSFPSSIPAFAGGGFPSIPAAAASKPMRGATFVLGDRSFAMQGSEAVVAAFERAVAQNGYSADGGSMPNWYLR